MAAYAALVSVMHIIDQLQLHPRPPISLQKKEAQSLTTNISCLQDFLERYNSHFGFSNEADELESRIVVAARAAEDLIESHIVDRIDAGSGSSSHGEETSSIEFYQNLEKVIEEIDLIMKEVMQIKETAGIQDQLHRVSLTPAGSSRSAATGSKVSMVGVDEILIKLLDMLTNGIPDRQTISITGMGGIGKTTLARNIFENQVVVHQFDVLAWVTISQEYDVERILLELAISVENERKNLSQMGEVELGLKLHQSLSMRRYLIIMDDLWNVEVWDELQKFFPDNNNGSRILITTRLANLALQLSDSYSLQVNFLDENDSWNLLCNTVFGKESCPPELLYIGREISRNCKGLPLSIVVIGGLLTKSERALEYWGYIAENLNSIVNLQDDQHCLQILYTSYHQLPDYLKPCFLYMRVFPEDSVIHASKIIKLWVAEGFLRPIQGKSLEEVAEEYLQELVDWNLIVVHKRGSRGNIKFVIIHDLLRDLCSREADEQKFVGAVAVRQLTHEGRITQCRICVRVHTLEDASPARSLIWDSFGSSSPQLSSNLIQEFECYFKGFSESLNLRLLRVFEILVLTYESNPPHEMKHICFQDSVFKLLNLRYISFPQKEYSISPSIHRLWNLHSLIARGTTAVAPPEIWKMPLLRHVEFDSISLPDPPHDGFVLENLQTLHTIRIWDCREKLAERFPHIKKLKICQWELESWSVRHLNSIGSLHYLESLEFRCLSLNMPSHLDLLSNLTFPRSLKKLTLYGTRLRWEDITAKIGTLPLLQVLKLKMDSFIGPEWETVGGQFCSLKFLLISHCGLVNWTTDSTHFPCLQHLQLGFLSELKEIPLAIGEIPTLLSINLKFCSLSATFSARDILEDQQENYGNDVLQIEGLPQLNLQSLHGVKQAIQAGSHHYCPEERFSQGIRSI